MGFFDWLKPRKKSVPQSAATPEQLGISNLLCEANQLLRFRADNKAKMEANISFTQGLLARSDAPQIRLVVLHAKDTSAEYPWILLKAGTLQALHTYSGSDAFSDETFARLFGEQPRSTIWADHIAENCPRPGESVTPAGRRIYDELAQAIQNGKYVIDRIVRA